jgi:recombination protein RecA
MASSPLLQSLSELLPSPAPTVGKEGAGLPTGLKALDAAFLGGGLPRGRLTEIVGARGSGKATLVRGIVEETIAGGGWVAYVDAERTLAPRDWAHLEVESLWMVRPREPARAAWCADVLLRSGAFALVVLDSAPKLSRSVAVRLTRLARESGAGLVVVADEEERGSMPGGAVRLRVRRVAGGGRRIGERRAGDVSVVPSPASRKLTVVVEKGGIHRTVEVGCAIGVARRLCAHPEVPDRRGVASRAKGKQPGNAGGTGRAVPTSVPDAERVLARKRRCAEPDYGHDSRVFYPLG